MSRKARVAHRGMDPRTPSALETGRADLQAHRADEAGAAGARGGAAGALPAGGGMSGLRRAGAVAWKDLLLEWRRRETVAAMVFLSVLTAVLLGFALGGRGEVAPAVLWVALALGAVLGVSRLTVAEAEQGTLEALLLYPGAREHLFWGKWAALTGLLTALAAILLPLVAVLFGMAAGPRWPVLAGTMLFGIVGLAAVGTLFAAMALHVRGRELLVPLLLLPLALPVLLAGIRLTEAILGAGQAGPWPAVLLVFDILFLLVAPILFELVVEEV